MHIYIYDSFLSERKYASALAKIETRLTDLGLSGKICRLEIMKNVQNFIKTEIAFGAKTLVAVGDDSTLKTMVSETVRFGIPVGFIPIVGRPNEIGQALGIDPEEIACEIISARRVETVDVGSIGNFSFLTEISFAAKEIELSVDGQYSLELEKGEIKIINLPTGQTDDSGGNLNAQDGFLNLIISTEKKKMFSKKNGRTNIPFAQLVIEKAKLISIQEGPEKIFPPEKISVKKSALRLIVGRNRNF